MSIIVSLIGTLLGGFILFYCYRHIEKKHYTYELRSRAYLDYLNCITEQAQHNYSRLSNEAKSLQNRLTDAKYRICLYGSTQVIGELAKFERLGSTVTTDEQSTEFLRLLSAMRKDSITRNSMKASNLQPIVYGKYFGPR